MTDKLPPSGPEPRHADPRLCWCATIRAAGAPQDALCEPCKDLKIASLSASLRETQQAQAARVIRCCVTMNPCGTDTWAVGHPCPCMNCAEWLRLNTIDGLQAELRETQQRLAHEINTSIGTISGLRAELRETARERDEWQRKACRRDWTGGDQDGR